MKEPNLKFQPPVESHPELQREDHEELHELDLEELRTVAGGPGIKNEA